MEKAVFVAMRIGAFYMPPEGKNITDEHNEIYNSKGSVYFGKAGRIFGKVNLKAIVSTIDKFGTSSLYLIQKRSDTYNVHRASIYSITNTRPSTELFPVYYSSEYLKNIQLWFKIGEFCSCSSTILDDLRLFTSHKQLSSVIRECRTTLMTVIDKNNLH